ncbi:MAG: hypothetical protein JMN24_05150 [gamma proteobacterium endosymbiont of Lamellibrachia anaximandri]|nr:hypothetical protein [gamma proteobacterium endosymbiont of Lamellibrachia anaximandri]MBL3616225.1 hypothetical protein [gamma proteobacterium endosymbiont of Lamellibrachia anaximandri]
MKPTTLKYGEKLRIKPALGTTTETAYFVRRIPARSGRKAVNYVRFPEFAGLNGPDDDGTCEMSDYDLSRRSERVG